jgi:hypothetical protein
MIEEKAMEETRINGNQRETSQRSAVVLKSVRMITSRSADPASACV